MRPLDNNQESGLPTVDLVQIMVPHRAKGGDEGYPRQLKLDRVIVIE